MAQRDLLDPRIADNYNPKRTKGDRKTLALVCPKHGFIRGAYCPSCQETIQNTIHINTNEWVKGYYDNIDSQPIYIDSKEQLINECEKRGCYAKAFMKPKSQGKGYEMRRR